MHQHPSHTLYLTLITLSACCTYPTRCIHHIQSIHHPRSVIIFIISSWTHPNPVQAERRTLLHFKKTEKLTPIPFLLKYKSTKAKQLHTIRTISSALIPHKMMPPSEEIRLQPPTLESSNNVKTKPLTLKHHSSNHTSLTLQQVCIQVNITRPHLICFGHIRPWSASLLHQHQIYPPAPPLYTLLYTHQLPEQHQWLLSVLLTSAQPLCSPKKFIRSSIQHQLPHQCK